MSMRGPLRQWTFGDNGLVIDQRYAPIILCTWCGETTIEQVDTYFEWSETFFTRAAQEDHQLVMITDALDAGRPSASLRRHIVERNERQRTAQADAAVIASFFVSDNPVIRGALTAINWMSSRPYDLTAVPDLATAFDKAGRVLRERGEELPTELALHRYQRPSLFGSREG